MHGGDVLIIEKEDGTFRCCSVGMMWMTLTLQVTKVEQVLSNAEKLYNSFGTGDGSKEIDFDTLEDIKKDKRVEGDVYIVIPKTKDRFIKLEKFLAGDLTNIFPLQSTINVHKE